jgi:hypothetical protein
MARGIRDLLTLSKHPAHRLIRFMPALAAVAAYVIGLVIAPAIESDVDQQRWSGFFGTSAQVIATLLLALAIEARFVSRAQLFPNARWAHIAVGYVALGELAAVTGLSPSVAPCLYTQAFAITVGGGVGALITVVLIGARALTAEFRDREDDLAEQVAKRVAALTPADTPEKKGKGHGSGGGPAA